jgi:hypothetical protein
LRPIAPTVILALTLLGACVTPEPLPPEPPPEGPKFGSVEIERRDIFDLEERPGIFYEAANLLNVVVRERVIQREIDALFHPGQPYDPELLDELERNLRSLPFIAEATADPVPGPDDSVNVRVKTRDSFTLRLGLSAGLFGGGDNKFRATLGEEDFFGTGKRVQLTYKTDPDRDTLEGRYSDSQFLDGKHELNVKLASLSDGHEYSLAIRKPFKTLATPNSYGLDLKSSELDVRYFEDGEESAAVPVAQEEFGLFYALSYGTREDLTRPGLRLDYRQDRFDQATGDAAHEIEVPVDTKVLTFGPTLQRDWLPRFEKRTQLDAIDYVEDIPIGFRFDGFLGPQLRDPEDDSLSGSLAAAAALTAAGTIDRDHVLAAGMNTSFRLGDEPLGWSASTFVHYYFQGLPNQTWVVSGAFDAAWETEDLPIRYSLGEDSGLRGYPARQFNGTRRIRFNVEDRLFTDVDILSVRVGGVVFFDMGYAWDRGESFRFSDLRRSVGIGLRFGSAPLFGGRILRVDVGLPLDEADGEDLGVSVSVSVGQIVSVFENSEGLSNDLGIGF